MNKIISAALAAIFLLTTNAKAQERPATIPANNYQIGIHPVYNLANGLRIDIDRRLRNPRNWLSLGLVGYWAFEGSETTIFPLLAFSEAKSVSGAGAVFSFKHFLGTGRQICFIEAGVSAHYFDIRYNGWGFKSFEEDKLNYYEWYYDEISHSFPKVGSHLLFGVQLPSRSRVFVDGAIGIGYSHSFYNPELFLPNAYSVLYGLSRRGFYPTGEFRLGIRLGKL
ncbi:MAG: hypothetical protein LBD21_10865 [Tannerellaceae bacterium]|jgi:hypothetical protein|nr:hypothetical protein [Tannerellaceae bacterium]